MNGEPIACLIRKLDKMTTLSEVERRALAGAVGQVRSYGAHEDIVRDGEASAHLNVVLAGFACRQKLLPDGRRQIIAFLLPGDVCDTGLFLSRRMDHSIVTLSSVELAVISRDVALRLTEEHPRLARAFWSLTMTEAAVTREWLVNLGQRTALERLAHLLCEVHARLHLVGRTEGSRCELPLTQSELADTLALSTVHVNRTLQELRRAGLISMRSKSLIIHDFEALRAVAMFDDRYLRLNAEPGLGRPGVAAIS